MPIAVQNKLKVSRWMSAPLHIYLIDSTGNCADNSTTHSVVGKKPLCTTMDIDRPIESVMPIEELHMFV